MFVIWYLVLAVISAVQIRGTNIILNKPSVQSGTYTASTGSYSSSYANDGSKTGYPSMTGYQLDPYWQGDIQGFYTVTSISVTSGVDRIQAFSLRNAIIGVSVNNVDCPEGKMTRCGQWPDELLPAHTIVFNCSHVGPVRFVRIWREGVYGKLTLSEVEVEGEPSTLTETQYNKVKVQKVISPTKSLSARSEIDCSSKCSHTQPCLAFSYRSSEKPNCLLATDVTLTSDAKWVSYTVRTCL